MTDKEQKRIFANNLKRLLKERNMSQADVAKMIDVSPQTFNTWCQGIALPRMGKVQRLADFFRVSKSVLIDEEPDATTKSPYYLDPDAARAAQEAFDDPDLRALFDAARDSKADDIRMATDMLRRFKETNPDG